MAEPKEWMTRKEAARYLESIGFPVSHYSLARMAIRSNEGRGPPYVKSRLNTVRYRFIDLQEWAEKNAEKVT